MHSWFGKRGKLVRGLIIALALLLILLEWATRLLAGVVHSLIALLGLTRFEMWMRSLLAAVVRVPHHRNRSSWVWAA